MPILDSGTHMWRANRLHSHQLPYVRERQSLVCRWRGRREALAAIWLTLTQRQTKVRGSCVCAEVDDKHNGWLTYAGNPHGAGGMKEKEKKEVIISSVICSFNTTSSNNKVLSGVCVIYLTNISLFWSETIAGTPTASSFHTVVSALCACTPLPHLSLPPPSWVLRYSLMIFTPLVKNKLASLLVLPQSGCSTGNHQGGEGNKKALGKFTFPGVMIDGGEWRRGSGERMKAPGGNGLWHMW